MPFNRSSWSELVAGLSSGKVLTIIVIIVAALALSRITSQTLLELGKRVPRTRFTFSLLVPVTRIAIWMIALAAAIRILAPRPDMLLAVVASVGLALGLGAQDYVKSLIGGIMILIDRPYQLGDRVKIGEAYGEIDHIGLRCTKLTTPDDTRVTIPNSELIGGMAWNANSGVPDCQVVTDLYLPPQSDPIVASEIGYEAAYSSPFILLAKPVWVIVSDGYSYGPYLRVRIKAYVYDHRFEPSFQSDITLRAKSEFTKRGMLDGWNDTRIRTPLPVGN
jgi:MscS family membrane protein